tara:strand:+ start:3413 stop:4450 length:1038 start_codon:yes stop_codon:yes gene_type:complete
MPDYFKYMSKLNYDFPSNVDVEVQDIFRRFTFTQKTFDDPKNFEEYMIKEGERPEDVAVRFYGDPKLWWIILFTNNIIDVQNQWPKTSKELNTLFETFLKGNSYFVLQGLDAQSGDVIVKRDLDQDASISLDVFGVVDKYHKLLKRIDVKRSKGTFSKGDEFYLFRLNKEDEKWNPIGGFGNTACVQQAVGATSCYPINGPTTGVEENNYLHGPLCDTGGITFSTIQKVTTIKDGIEKFELNDQTISPYAVEWYVDGKFEGVTSDMFSFDNICGLTSTILYNYITDGAINTNINKHTTVDEIYRKDLNNRVIRVLHPVIVEKVIGQISALLQGKDIPRGTTRLVE